MPDTALRYVINSPALVPQSGLHHPPSVIALTAISALLTALLLHVGLHSIQGIYIAQRAEQLAMPVPLSAVFVKVRSSAAFDSLSHPPTLRTPMD